MKLDQDEVARIARLARLELAEAELQTIATDLNAILGYADKLGELDERLKAKGVEPTSHAVPRVNAFREDVVRESLPNTAAVGGAPARDDHSFQVPRVIE